MNRSRQRFALIVASFDGLVSVRTGVGVVVSAFFEEFHHIAALLGTSLENIDLYALSPYLQHNADEFDNSVFETTTAICKQNDGVLIEFSTFSGGQNRSRIWAPQQKGTSGALQWRSMALAAAGCVETIAKRYDRVLVIHHDTVLSQLPRYLHSENIKTMWIPHSLATVFNNNWATTTIPFEQKAMGYFPPERSSVGYISAQFHDAILTMIAKTRLRKDSIKLYPLSNNFDKITVQKFTKSEVIRTLKQYGIPVNKPLMFSWARCVEQKGWDLLLPEIEKIIQDTHKEFHFVMVVAFKPEANVYQTSIDFILRTLEKYPNITILRHYDDLLPKVVLNHTRLDTVILPSRAEGMSLAGLEIRNQNRQDIKIVCSNIHSFRETFEHCPNVHFFDPKIPDSLSIALSEAITSATQNYSNTPLDRAYSSYATAISEELSS